MARLIGINHVALEVGDVEEALAWYGRFFEFELRGRIGSSMAFIDMGISSSRSPQVEGSRPIKRGASGSSSMTRRASAQRFGRRGSTCGKGAPSTS